jgi:hypothetical protein
VVIRNALRVSYLKDTALCKIPEKDLPVVVCVARVYSSNVPPGFENDKPTVAGDTSRNRLSGRIGKLPYGRIVLSPDRDRDRRQGYDY